MANNIMSMIMNMEESVKIHILDVNIRAAEKFYAGFTRELEELVPEEGRDAFLRSKKLVFIELQIMRLIRQKKKRQARLMMSKFRDLVSETMEAIADSEDSRYVAATDLHDYIEDSEVSVKEGAYQKFAENMQAKYNFLDEYL